MLDVLAIVSFISRTLGVVHPKVRLTASVCYHLPTGVAARGE